MGHRTSLVRELARLLGFWMLRMIAVAFILGVVLLVWESISRAENAPSTNRYPHASPEAEVDVRDNGLPFRKCQGN